MIRPASQPSMEPSKSVGKHQRHDQDSGPKDEHVLGLAETEAANATNQQIADGKVEESP